MYNVSRPYSYQTREVWILLEDSMPNNSQSTSETSPNSMVCFKISVYPMPDWTTCINHPSAKFEKRRGYRTLQMQEKSKKRTSRRL